MKKGFKFFGCLNENYVCLLYIWILAIFSQSLFCGYISWFSLQLCTVLFGENRDCQGVAVHAEIWIEFEKFSTASSISEGIFNEYFCVFNIFWWISFVSNYEQKLIISVRTTCCLYGLLKWSKKTIKFESWFSGLSPIVT